MSRYACALGIVALSVCAVADVQAAAGQPGLDEPGLRSIGGGKWAVTVQQLVPPGDYAKTEDPACSAPANVSIQAALAAITAAVKIAPALKVLAGPIVDAAGKQLDAEVRKQGGDIGFLISPNRIASCATLAVKIPEGSTVTKIKYTAGDGGKGVFDCPKDAHGWPVCACGWSRWEPAVQSTSGVAALFKNWSADRHRWASLTVEFVPPAGVTPKAF